jgi:hypothetical protein
VGVGVVTHLVSVVFLYRILAWETMAESLTELEFAFGIFGREANRVAEIVGLV